MILGNSALKLKNTSLTFDKVNELESLFKRRFHGRHHRGILNSLLFYLFCFYFLFLYNLILLFLIGNTCTEMVNGKLKSSDSKSYKFNLYKRVLTMKLFLLKNKLKVKVYQYPKRCPLSQY